MLISKFYTFNETYKFKRKQFFPVLNRRRRNNRLFAGDLKKATYSPEQSENQLCVCATMVVYVQGL